MRRIAFSIFFVMAFKSMALRVPQAKQEEAELIGSFSTERPSCSNARHYGLLFVTLIAQNCAHLLPYLMGEIEDWDYPKDKTLFYLRTGDNRDNTAALLQKWSWESRKFYNWIDFKVVDEVFHQKNLILLYDQALTEARLMRAEYALFIDGDILLNDNKVLSSLMKQKKPIIAPLLDSVKHYRENFWIEPSYGYTFPMHEVAHRKMTGLFKVSGVRSFVLIDLTVLRSRYLTFDPMVLQNCREIDPWRVFAESAKRVKIERYVQNNQRVGYYLGQLRSLPETKQLAKNFHLSLLPDSNPPFLSSPIIPPDNYPVYGKLGLDEIYYINLGRREDRRKHMEASFDLLGLNATRKAAFDSSDLVESWLCNTNGISFSMHPGYLDSTINRVIKLGEVAHVISHYITWADAYFKNHTVVMIMEDNVLFHERFTDYLQKILDDIKSSNLVFDLIYLGRNAQTDGRLEFCIENQRHLKTVDYSHGVWGYIISRTGIAKLLVTMAGRNMVHMDELFPLMYRRTRLKDIADGYYKRKFDDFKAFTVDRNLLELSLTENGKPRQSDIRNTRIAIVNERTGSFCPEPMCERD